ncbi:MAG: HAD family hydrolase [Alphaproteobacteria bacterium]|nr:HAD family hydrolase [Alphaproteobacteria bacterium]
MNNWMQALADHYATLRQRYPEDRLLIVFDIDGTIIDMRYIVAHVLRAYDAEHGTGHFDGLVFEDIHIHENFFSELMASLGVAAAAGERIEPWYHENLGASATIDASHKPFPGAMELIRWFQSQPRTYVALNTGRPEHMRDVTIQSLNAVGREYGIEFASDLLWMNADDWEDFVPQTKAVGLREFRKRGYRIVAAIDNEPNNIESMASVDEDQEILFLHADTIYRSPFCETPRTVRGDTYDVTPFLAAGKLAAE